MCAIFSATVAAGNLKRKFVTEGESVLGLQSVYDANLAKLLAGKKNETLPAKERLRDLRARHFARGGSNVGGLGSKSPGKGRGDI